MFNKKYFVLVLLAIGFEATAQIKIGNDPTNINVNSVLELESNNKGFLLPRVALSSTNNFSPLNQFVAGMTVYNTATAGVGNTAVEPGFYYSDGTRWVKIGTSPDGSETIVTAGTNITVTGAGTSASPYVINAGNVADATAITKGIIQLAGDLSGTAAAPNVVKLQGQAVSATQPTANQALVWNGTAWAPTTVATNNLYTTDGTLAGNRVVSQGTNTLGFTSTATTGTSHFTVDGTTLNVDAVNNRIGIGNSAPTSALTIVSNGQGGGPADDFELASYNSTGSSPTIYLRSSRGTLAAPLAAATGDLIGNIIFTPRAGTSFPTSTLIESRYRGNGTTNLSDLTFSTSGSTRMGINENGAVSINNLAGAGSRMVVADATGVLSTQALPATADGSETKVTAGTNVTVTGAGTTASPYIVNAAGAADATTTTNGIVRLAGDLSGTAAAPTVANNAITSAKILDGTIATGDLANDAITSAKILDGTIATADLANSAITGAKIENNVALPGTSSMTLPSGTTAQRPATATAGMSRYNTTDNIMEYYNGTAWIRPTAGTTYTGSTSTVLNGTSFERAALTGDVTATQNSNALTIANNAVNSAKIADGTILAADLNQMAATSGQVLKWNGTAWAPAADNNTTADGSETKVTAGTNVTVTGAGTTASPYIVNAAGAADATTTTNGIVRLAGDLSGTAAAPTVANNAITSAKILDGTIATADLANSAITGAKIENNVALPGTASMTLPSGTTAQRPATATAGMSRYNTTDNIMEYYNGTAWIRPTAGTTYTGSTSTVLNGTSFERAALTGDVTATQNSNALTIANNAVNSAKIADGTIVAADLNQMAATSGQALVWNGTAWAPSTVAGDNLGNHTATQDLNMSTFAINGVMASNDMWKIYGAGTSDGGSMRIQSGDNGSEPIIFESNNTGVISERMRIAGNGTVSINNLAGTGSRMVVADATGVLSTQALPATADGSETKVTAGTNVTVTGAGTTASPYVVNAAGAADATTTTNGIVRLAGDLSGTAAAPTVANNAITSAKILDGTIATADLANSAITGAKIENNVALPGTASMTLPSGTTAQRPATATAGMSRYNTTDNIMEYYNGTAWIRPTAGTTYTGSTSTVLNGTSFERAALTGDVTATQNSNALTIANNAVNSAKIADGTIVAADLNQMAATNGQALVWNGTAWAPSTVSSDNIYTANGSLTGNRTVAQGTNTLGFTSTATTGTSHFTVDGATLNVDAVNNRVGIGTATPSSAMTIVNNGQGGGAADDIEISSFNTAGSSPTIFLRSSRGTEATPASAVAGDMIGNIIFTPRAGTNFPTSTIIESRYRGNGTTNLSDLTFTTSGTTRMGINENGAVSINNLVGTGSRMVVADATGVLSTQAIPSAQTGSTSVVLNAGSFERAALTGDVTAAQNSNALTIANGAITAAKINQMAATSGQALVWNGTAWAPTTVTSVNIYNSNGSITANEARTVAFGTGSSLNFDSNTLFIDATNNRIGMGTNSPNSSLSTSGSFACPIKTASTNVSLTIDDNILLCDAASSALTVTLPNPTACIGRVYVIKKTDTTNNTVTFSSAIKTSSADNFNSVNYQMSLKIQSDGTNWWLVD